MSDLPRHYYCDYDDSQDYWEIMFIDGRYAQGREMNNLQKQVGSRITGLGDALFSNGDIHEGSEIVVNQETGNALLQPGIIYLMGAMRSVPGGRIEIPMEGLVSVGVYLRSTVITEMEDPSLFNPATTGEGSGEPGACRLRITPSWGYAGDGGEGDFFPVHIVEDGIVRAKEPPPHLESYNQAIAAYDVASTGGTSIGGTYVCSGMSVRQAPNNADGQQVYTVAEGMARVQGRGLKQATSVRVAYDTTPDLRTVRTEVHTATSGTYRVSVAHPPIHTITSISVTRQKTVSVLRGTYTGGADMLPDTGVVAILECRQGGVVYAQGADYRKVGDNVDWSPGGSEPEPGSTYTCVYTFLDEVQPEGLDYDGFTVTDAVEGSNIIISYVQALPRRDRLCITQEGQYVWHKGVASERYPYPPDVPSDVLALATILQTWREANTVEIDAPIVMPWNSLNALAERVEFAIREIARTRLEADVTTRENGARAGVFVDDLEDDTGRDQGITQTGAVFGGKLQLPISLTVYNLDAPARPACPAYAPVNAVEQPLRTGSEKVNPYMAFPDLPAVLTLDPSVDHWTEEKTVWTSSTTQVFEGGSASATTEIVSSVTTQLDYLRPIRVEFTIDGFGGGEILDELVFDGMVVPFEPSSIVADPDGRASGSFVIPENIPSGAKTVEVNGRGRSHGSAVFIGSGEQTTNTLRTVQTSGQWWWNVDPQSETFTPEKNMMLCGVDLWFTAVGGEVRVQLRESDGGFPSRTILAEAALSAEDINLDEGPTRFLFDCPMYLISGMEYAFVVLCADAVTSISVATLGGFDPYLQVKVLSQPYALGVRNSSSNASTWTAHQDSDLTFRLLAAEFSQDRLEVDMGTVYVTDCTDLILQSVAETPTATTSVEYELTLPDGSTVAVAAKQRIQLPAPVDGPIIVKAILRGDADAAPILWPGAQLFVGTLATTGDYYSRSIPAISAIKATLIYDAYVPDGSSVVPEIQIDGGAWQEMIPDGTVQQGDGVVEHTLVLDLNNSETAKCRFRLAGSAAARPHVQNVRLLTTK
ncbi:DUF4815 domain-containing protein [Desulfosarcina sp. OttesenSCG-928-A07]|nr:DUF4815 domain-containing protein [Desulfosarcina sp. OttesenSCG-928-A07]